MPYKKNKTKKWPNKKSIKDALLSEGFNVPNKDIRKSTTGRSWNVYSGTKLFALNITNGSLESLVVWCNVNLERTDVKEKE